MTLNLTPRTKKTLNNHTLNKVWKTRKQTRLDYRDNRVRSPVGAQVSYLSRTAVVGGSRPLAGAQEKVSQAVRKTHSYVPGTQEFGSM